VGEKCRGSGCQRDKTESLDSLKEEGTMCTKIRGDAVETEEKVKERLKDTARGGGTMRESITKGCRRLRAETCSNSK